MEAMVTYPSYLLPKKHYKFINNKEWIRFLTVFTWSKDNKDPITGDIDQKSFCHPSQKMDDFSSSLLGIFTPEDNYIQILGPKKDFFTTYWGDSEEVPEPQHPYDFNFNYERGYFFLDAYEFVDEIKVEYEKDKQTYEAWPKVIHTPTRANFWHISIRWVDSDDQEIRASKNLKEWQRRLYTEARNLLIEFAKFEEPSFAEIPQSVYQREHF